MDLNYFIDLFNLPTETEPKISVVNYNVAFIVRIIK